MSEDYYLYGLRDAYLYNQRGLSPDGSAGVGSMSGNYTTPNPPFGAVFTFHAHPALDDDQTLVMTITDDDGEQVREMELEAGDGMQRAAWDLRADPPQRPAGQGGGRGGFGGGRGQRGPIVEPGRYHATIGVKTGEGEEATVEAVGMTRSFRVIPLQ
jgi:hypothetical protein